MATSQPNIKILEEYCHMMDMGSSHIISHYLADDVVLDWYGRTIAGKQDVLGFLFREIHIIQHELVEVQNPRPLARKDTLLKMKTRVNLKTISESEDFENDFDDDSGFMSGLYESNSDSSCSSSRIQTPCSKVAASFAHLNIASSPAPAPVLQLDAAGTAFQTPRNFSHPPRYLMKMAHAAPQKARFSSWDRELNVNYIEAKGTVSFSRYEALHNTYLQRNRDCCLQLGYSCEFYSERTVCFSVLSYQDDMRCRRNLSSIFEQCD